MKSRDLQKLLAQLTGRTAREVDERTRPLRHLEFIQSGPRGFQAPVVTHPEAAFHLMSMAARRAADASDVQRRLTNECRYVPHPTVDLLPANVTFAAALTLYLEEPHQFGGTVEMADDGSMAWIGKRLAGGKITRLLFRCAPAPAAPAEAAPYESADDYFTGSRFVIGAAVMVHISKQIGEHRAVEAAPAMAKAG